MVKDCKWCGHAVSSISSQECQRHLEMRLSIEREPERAAQMLNDFARKQHEAAAVLA